MAKIILRIKIAFYWILVKIKTLIVKFWKSKFKHKIYIFIVLLLIFRELRLLIFKIIIQLYIWLK